jgi:hypothetical protein
VLLPARKAKESLASAESNLPTRAQRAEMNQRLTNITVQRVETLRAAAAASQLDSISASSSASCSAVVPMRRAHSSSPYEPSAPVMCADLDVASMPVLTSQVLTRVKACAERGGSAFVKDELVHLVVLLHVLLAEKATSHADSYARLQTRTVDELYTLARLLMYNPAVLSKLKLQTPMPAAAADGVAYSGSGHHPQNWPLNVACCAQDKLVPSLLTAEVESTSKDTVPTPASVSDKN